MADAKYRPVNRAQVKESSSDVLKDRMLKFRQVEKANYRLYFQIKGNENYKIQSAGKGSITYWDLLENNNYPVNVSDTDYWVPLAIGESKKKNSNLKNSDIKLMPVFPLAFSEPDGSRLMHLRQGYLYVFIDGFLWREFYVSGAKWEHKWEYVKNVETDVNEKWSYTDLQINNWKFHDVNLTRYQGQDQRPPMNGGGALIGAIVIPYKVGKNTPKVEMCFSSTQWSWRHICKMGGMDKENDPRYISHIHKNKTYNNIKASSNLKASRLQKINLSEYTGIDLPSNAKALRKSCLMPIKQAYKLNSYMGGKIYDVKKVKNEVAYRMKMFPEQRRNLLYLNPYKMEGIYNGGSQKLYKNKNNIVDYINSTLPIVALYDPIGVTENLYFRFKNQLEKYTNHAERTTHETTIARYCQHIIKSDDTLHNKFLVKNKMQDYHMGGIADGHEVDSIEIQKDVRKHAKELIKYMDKEPIADKALDFNNLSSSFLDYDVLDAYEIGECRSKASDAGHQWLSFLEKLSSTPEGEAYLVRLADPDKSSNADIFYHVVCNKDIEELIAKERKEGNIRPFADPEKYRKLVDKENKLKKEITYAQYKKDTLEGASSYRKNALLAKQISYIGRQMRLFIKAIVTTRFRGLVKFPWNNFEELLIKVCGIKVVESKMNLDEWLKLMQDDEIRVRPQGTADGRNKSNGYKIGSKKLKSLIRSGEVKVRQPKSIRQIVLYFMGKKIEDFGDKLGKIFDYRVIAVFQLADIGLKLWLLEEQKIENTYYKFKLMEMWFASGQALAVQLELLTGRKLERNLAFIRSKVEKGTYNSKKAQLSNTIKGKAKYAKFYGKWNIISGKAGGILGILAEGSGLIANFSNYHKMLNDRQERKAEFYLYSTGASNLAILGNLALFSSYFITAGLAGALIPIIGWVLVIASIIFAIYIWWAFSDDSDTPKEFWVQHCYWGKDRYAYKIVRNEKNKIYLNYKEWENDKISELNEIHKIVNAYTLKGHWYNKSKLIAIQGKEIANNKKSVVVDISIPNWNDNLSMIKLNVSGFRKLDVNNSAKSNHKVELLGSNIDNDGKLKSTNITEKKYTNIKPSLPFWLLKQNRKASTYTTFRIYIESKKIGIDISNFTHIEIECRYYPYPNGKAFPEDKSVVLTLKSEDIGYFINKDYLSKSVNSYDYQKNNR